MQLSLSPNAYSFNMPDGPWIILFRSLIHIIDVINLSAVHEIYRWKKQQAWKENKDSVRELKRDSNTISTNMILMGKRTHLLCIFYSVTQCPSHFPIQRIGRSPAWWGYHAPSRDGKTSPSLKPLFCTPPLPWGLSTFSPEIVNFWWYLTMVFSI